MSNIDLRKRANDDSKEWLSHSAALLKVPLTILQLMHAQYVWIQRPTVQAGKKPTSNRYTLGTRKLEHFSPSHMLHPLEEVPTGY